MDLGNPAQVKNLMRRGLRFLFDPESSPEEKRRGVAFFEGRCAYCDEPTGGKHDFDHLVSSAAGGANHISNRVLSCKPCNHSLKRERDWQELITELWKHKDPEREARLTARIEEWVTLHKTEAPSEAIVLVWKEACARTTTEYNLAVRQIWEAKRNTSV